MKPSYPIYNTLLGTLCIMSILCTACDKQKRKTTVPVEQSNKQLNTFMKTAYIEPLVPMHKQLEKEKKSSLFLEVNVTTKQVLIEKKVAANFDAQGQFADKGYVASIAKVMTSTARPRAKKDRKFIVGMVVDKGVPIKVLRGVYYSLGMAQYDPIREDGKAFVTFGGPSYHGIIYMNRVGDEPSVFKLSASKVSVGPPPEKPRPREVHVNMTLKGFEVSMYQQETKTQKEETIKQAVQKGCPVDGPTICHKNKGTVALIQSLSTLKGKKKDAAINAVARHYDFRTLYNVLVDIKKANPDTEVIHLGMDDQLPADLLGLLAAHVRFKRPDASTDGKFKDDKSYNSKRFANMRYDQCGNGGDKCLFPFTVFKIAR